jgi:hypothetical protein
MEIATGYLFPQFADPSYKMGLWTLFAATCFTGIGNAIMTMLTIKESKKCDREGGNTPEGIVVDFDQDGKMEGHEYWRYHR